jgi:hypothetical protein
MIDSACDYDIGENVTLFSTATRSVAEPYKQLFNTIMGHRFGKHTAWNDVL